MRGLKQWKGYVQGQDNSSCYLLPLQHILRMDFVHLISISKRSPVEVGQTKFVIQIYISTSQEIRFK